MNFRKFLNLNTNKYTIIKTLRCTYVSVKAKRTNKMHIIILIYT